jgi:hypothetical protein
MPVYDCTQYNSQLPRGKPEGKGQGRSVSDLLSLSRHSHSSAGAPAACMSQADNARRRVTIRTSNSIDYDGISKSLLVDTFGVS